MVTPLKRLWRPRWIISGLVLIYIAGWVSDYVFELSPSSRHVLAWVRTHPAIKHQFGNVRGAAIAKLTVYGNPSTGLREREYVIIINGSSADGTITVVDADPDSQHEYRIR